MSTRVGSLSRSAVTLCLSVVMSAAAAMPAVADEQGVVNATVTVTAPAEACILVGVSSIDFGTLDFGDAAPGESYTIQKCAEASQDLFVQGTNATTTSGFAWQLVDTLPGVNEYRLEVFDVAIGTESVFLSPDESRLVDAEMSDSLTVNHVLNMPAEGSDGAGETASFQIIWTAVLSAGTVGDGIIDQGEECDDGNLADGDGCSSTGQIEPGWTCEGEPSVCTES
ncbi:MAG: myxococcus cysteine-rich repeat containing protein [Actinomycetota bacterium]